MIEMTSWFYSLTGLDLTAGSTLVIFIVFGLSLLQLIDLKAEYYSPFTSEDWGDDWTWHIHHDEKILIPDARFFFLRKRMVMDIMDYKPYPVSAAFGFAGPLLVKTGFNIFGMNNLGLRFFYVLIGGFANLCCVFCILHLAPGFIGVGISILYLFNYRNFILTRHAILENILTSFLCGIVFMYFSQGELFVQNIHIIGFFVGVSFWFKVSFGNFIYPLLMLILLFENPGITSILRFSAWSLAGVIIFEGLHLLILLKMGLARWRYINFIAALKAHSGTDTGILQKFQPDGINVLRNFFRMFCRWYGLPINIWKRFSGWINGLMFSVILFYVFFVGIGKLGGILSLYILIYLGICAPFFFYLKRAVSCFPVVLMFISLLIYSAASGCSRYLPGLEVFIGLFIIVIAFISLSLQLRGIARFHFLRSQSSEKYKDLNHIFSGDGEVVYAHCYVYRFFWQMEKAIIMSSDDQIMNNQMIVDWALKEQGKYIFLSGRGGDVDWFDNNLAEGLRYVDSFETTARESDEADVYALFENLNSGCNTSEKVSPASDLERVNNTIHRMELLYDAWPFFKKVGVHVSALHPNRHDFLDLLYEHRADLSVDASNQISEVYTFLSSDYTYRPVLNAFGEELLLEIILQEENFERGIDALQGNGYEIQAFDWFCAIGDFYSGRDSREAVKWYFRFIDTVISDGMKWIGHPGFASTMQKIYVQASELKSVGRYDIAKEIFLCIKKYRFQLWGVYFHLGEIALKTNEIGEAKKYFLKCIKENPQHKKARQYLKSVK